MIPASRHPRYNREMNKQRENPTWRFWTMVAVAAVTPFILLFGILLGRINWPIDLLLHWFGG